MFAAGPRPAELQRVVLTYLDAQPKGVPTAASGSLAGLLAGPAGFRSQIIPREAWGADESLRFAPDGTEKWPRAYVPAKKVVVHHTASDVIAALRAHRVPERLRAAGRQRLTCLRAGGKIIVQPPE